jgi:hypothetical protein
MHKRDRDRERERERERRREIRCNRANRIRNSRQEPEDFAGSPICPEIKLNELDTDNLKSQIFQRIIDLFLFKIKINK